MNTRRFLKIIARICQVTMLLGILVACSPSGSRTIATVTPPVNVAVAVGAQDVAERFLIAWSEEHYDSMYEGLSSLSQDALSEADFVETYQSIAKTLTLQSLDYQVLSSLADHNQAQVAYRLVFHTKMAGDLSRDTLMNLVWENDQWRIQWERGMILPDLRDGHNLLWVAELPDRGRIYDRQGAPLAAYEDAIAIGLVPGEVLSDQTDSIYALLSEISAFNPDELADLVERTPDDWYLPIVSLSRADAASAIEALRGLSGVRIDEFRSRFYLDGGVAPHVLGYRLFIPEEELDYYLRQGYQQDERIGAAGLEAAFEPELSGQRGGSLFLTDSQGKIVRLLATHKAQPGQTLTTTIDKRLQMQLQDSLGDQRAAVVVMEVDTGRILSLVSTPGFDPNAFDLAEIDHSLLDSYFSNENQPLFNRATQGQYPLGSIFKIITMSAALETGVYSPYSSFYCGQSYWVCDSVTLYDWTYAHGAAASGDLTLPEGLMRSCNPWFYRIGETLYTQGFESALSDLAVGFGLGSETGIEIAEAAGNIPPTASSCVDSAQLAIGQGEILVTPLQVATFISALANGGTLYQPTLVEKMSAGASSPDADFSPVIMGLLPISEDTRNEVLAAMQMVVENTRGTGFWPLKDLSEPVSGKTGTAQTPSGEPHAWFAGFSRQNDPDRPDIAVVVLIENGGEGSVMAAPVFRRVMALYFSDGVDAGGVMPWETAPFVPYSNSPEAGSPDDSPSDD